MTTNTKPLSGHVYTPTENDVFQNQEVVAPSTQFLDIEYFQLQKTIEDLVESPEKVTSKTDNNDHSSMMNLCREHDSCQTISMMPIFTIDSTTTNHIYTFVEVLDTQLEIAPINLTKYQIL